MRITKPIRKELYNRIVAKAYPLSVIEEMAKPIVDYLLGGGSEAFNEGVEIYNTDPESVVPSNTLRFSAEIGSTASVLAFENAEITLPVRYAVKRPFNWTARKDLTFKLDCGGLYIDSYGINLPPELKDVCSQIFGVLQKRGEFRMALSALDACHSKTALIKALPEAEDIINEVLHE